MGLKPPTSLGFQILHLYLPFFGVVSFRNVLGQYKVGLKNNYRYRGERTPLILVVNFKEGDTN